MAKIKLGYWDIRGLAQPIRYALEYKEEPYEETLYQMGQAPEFDRGKWKTDKTSLGLEFPNLPYLFDGDFHMTESLAILKYVCNKLGLMPKTAKALAKADNVEYVIAGLRMSYYGQFFTPEEKFEETKKTFREKTFPETINKIIKFKSDNKWLVCDEITHIDFLFYETLAQAQCLNPTCLKEFPTLEKYVSNFESLPTIAKYLASPKFKKFPITAPVARWGFTAPK